MNEKASEFTVFQYLPLEQFHKVDELTYELAIKASGRLGIDQTSVSVINEIYVTIDGRTLADRETFWAYDFQQQRIEVLLNKCEIKDTIRIHFSSVEQAANFHGIMISSQQINKYRHMWAEQELGIGWQVYEHKEFIAKTLF